MRNRSLVPRPWWQVGLTVLPGFIFLLGQVSSRSKPLNTGLRFLAWAVMILYPHAYLGVAFAFNPRASCGAVVPDCCLSW
jgi:hypothetical protein